MQACSSWALVGHGVGCGGKGRGWRSGQDLQAPGSSQNFIPWNLCPVEVLSPWDLLFGHHAGCPAGSLVGGWYQGMLREPGERAAGAEAVAVEMGYRGPAHTPDLSDQGWDLKPQPRGVSHGKGGRCEGCSGLQPGEPALLCQPTLRALSLTPSKHLEKTRRSPGCTWPPLTFALTPGGGPCKQQCRDTGEEVVCSCFVGYQLLPDGVSCEGKRRPALGASASA